MRWNPLHRKHHPDPWKGLAAGLAGGVAGTLALGAFHAVAAAAVKRRSRRAEDPEGPEGIGKPWRREEPALEPDTSEAISPRPPGGALAQAHARGALAVRYGLGTSFGALYGLACEWHADLGQVGGAPLGAAVMLLTDQVALPLAKLSPSPLRVAPAAHVQALAAHVLYGVVCEATRRRVRGLLA